MRARSMIYILFLAAFVFLPLLCGSASADAVTGQTAMVSLSSNPTTTGNPITVSTSIAGLNFTSPAYSWSAVGSCPAF